MSVDPALYEEAFTLVEDILRLDPWQRSEPLPWLVFQPEETPDAIITIALYSHEDRRDLYLLSGENGLRAHLDWQRKASAAERYVARFDQRGLRVQNGDMDALHLRDSESDALRCQDDRCTVLQQLLPGQPAAMLEDPQLLQTLIRCLFALRQILQDPHTVPTLMRQTPPLELPAWRLGSRRATATTPYLLPAWQAQMSPPLLDEFTCARLARAPYDMRTCELFFFYLPMSGTDDDSPLYPRVFFLVDLDSGLIEWSDVFRLSEEEAPQRLLRRLADYFIESSSRPDTILISHRGLYEALHSSLGKSGIYSEPITQSYVGDELMEAYLEQQADMPIV